VTAPRALDAPLVSVVTPVYNAGPFLTEAVESVFAQTESHWELLLVDDGSTDGSAEVARAFAARDPARVRCLAHPGGANLGTGTTRDLGVRHARGEYVAILDQDDVWVPVKLERQLAEFAAHPDAALLYGPALYWYGWTGRPADVGRDHVVGTGYPPGAVVPAPALLARYLREPGTLPVPSAALVRRTALEPGASPAELVRDVYEDQVVLARLAARYPAVMSGGCYTRYRQHDRSASSGAARAGREWEARGRFLAWLRGYLTECGLEGTDVWAALGEAEAAFARRTLDPPPERGPRRMAAVAARRALGALPAPAGRAVRDAVGRARAARAGTPPPPGAVRMGDLRTTRPFDETFGYGRGGPLDRVYIEEFLADHAADVRGRALEVGDPSYTLRFGGDRVTRADVLHVDAANPHATVVADLEHWPDAPEAAFDCVVLTQTLHLMYDVRGALGTLNRILRPGGVLLLTVPGITPIDRAEWRHTWYWSFTEHALRRLLADAFGAGRAEVTTYGNVLAATGFLYGLGAGELTPEELAVRDPAFPVIVGARVVRGG
jgi:SAM-dependent methyltransferase